MTILMIGTTEIIFIAIIILLLFGGKKIPELMKGLGKGMRSFKQGMNGEDEQPQTPQQETPPTAENPQDNVTSVTDDGKEQ
mgnify:CR=1 FL=1